MLLMGLDYIVLVSIQYISSFTVKCVQQKELGPHHHIEIKSWTKNCQAGRLRLNLLYNTGGNASSPTCVTKIDILPAKMRNQFH